MAQAGGEKEADGAPAPHQRRTMKDQAREMVRVYRKEFVRNWLLFKESKIGVVGLAIILFFIFMAIFAPVIPYASSRHPTEWQGPVTDYTDVRAGWFSSTTGAYYVSDTDAHGRWGTRMTASAILFAQQSSGQRVDLILQGTEKGLFGIAPGKSCRPGLPSPPNPCLPTDDVRENFRMDGIGEVTGTPIVNTHRDKSGNYFQTEMWRNRIYATTSDGKLWSFRVIYNTADPNFPPDRIEHGGPGATNQTFETGGNTTVSPAFDFVGECEQTDILVANCMNTVYVVTEDRIHRVREHIWNESQSQPYPWAGRWTEVWNYSYGGEGFRVVSDPLFAPAQGDLGRGTQTVSMLLMTGSDGRVHAYRSNNSNRSAPFGEKAWVWPDQDRPDDCYNGPAGVGPLNPGASPAARPRGVSGEWLRPPTSRVYVSSADGRVFALSITGECLRTYRVGSDQRLWTPNLTETEEQMQVGSEDGNVYEFYAEGAKGNETKTRAPIWGFRTTGAVKTRPFSSNLFLGSNRLFAASDQGTVYLLEADREHKSALKVFSLQFPPGSVIYPPIKLEVSGGLKEKILITTSDGRMGIFEAQGQYFAPLAPGCYASGTCYPLGTDFLGRDVFSQLVWGSQLALMIGFLAAFFSIAIGLIVGLVAGYFGGKVDSVLMRFTDVVLVLPGLPFLIVLASVLGTNIFNLVLVIALIGWPGTARIIRAEVLSLKERPYVDAARVTGASHARIMFKHISPNVFPLVFLFLTFAVSGAIISEASLSFIGLGDTNRMSWGIMLYYAQYTGNALTAWWWLLPPGIAITLISLGFFLVGRAFEQIINPRLRKR
jgi:peptide/nickel transport system permease protein